MKFAQPFSRDRYNFKGSFFIQNYGVKNLENINEVGLGLGVGVNFGITGNQIDFGYKFSKRSGLHLIDKETLHTFNVGVSIGDLWFVKRREI
jgi:opacity protein-like surface antigen